MDPVLSMSAHEIKRELRRRRPALWGSMRGQQYGSPSDLAIAHAERRHMVQLAYRLARAGEEWRAAMLSFAEAGKRMAEARLAMDGSRRRI